MIYKVVKQAISKELADFVYSYFLMKRKVAKTLFDARYISPFNLDWGGFNEPQIPNTYCHYGDIAMETLLDKLIEPMSKETGLNLVPTYTYARIYKKGDVLKRHKDRNSCEVSMTLNLGGDPWAIYLEPSGEVDKEGVKIDLEPGDALIYRGNDVEHWREAFEGESCGQVFLHYNDASSEHAEENKYDTRPFLGLPVGFRKDERV